VLLEHGAARGGQPQVVEELKGTPVKPAANKGLISARASTGEEEDDSENEEFDGVEDDDDDDDDIIIG
jgi:hypothetical protein